TRSEDLVHDRDPVERSGENVRSAAHGSGGRDRGSRAGGGLAVVSLYFRGGHPSGTRRKAGSMLAATQLVAAFTAILFSGAALYVNVAEHPARMALETRMAVLQWAPSYKRATMLQAPLALVSCAAGVTAWFLGANVWWLAAALIIGSVVPYTFIAVMPTNEK